MSNRAWMLAASIAVFGVPSVTFGQTSDTFYRGKQIHMILGAAAGQDYDTWARLIVRHMGKHIPGNPTFVVQNMPGGGHMIATNHLYNVAAQDGSVMGMVSRNIPTQAILKHPSVRYDPLKFNWIGSPELTNRACFAMANSDVKTAQDLFERELVVGGTGPGSSVSTTPLLLSNLLGMKFKLVEGYKSPDEAVLAMERGEVNGLCQTVTSFENTRPDWIKSGKIRILFNLEQKPLPNSSVPTVYQFVKTDEQRKILSFYSASIELGRPIMTPPNVPPQRVNTLRRAFDATMKDPALLQEAKAVGFEVNAQTGEEIEALVQALAATPEDILKKAEDMTRGQ